MVIYALSYKLHPDIFPLFAQRDQEGDGVIVQQVGCWPYTQPSRFYPQAPPNMVARHKAQSQPGMATIKNKPMTKKGHEVIKCTLLAQKHGDQWYDCASGKRTQLPLGLYGEVGARGQLGL